ncbi:MAG: ABC transporter permease [Cloacibacterium sp.]|nr:ABC transporter permease [Cloacibacterium sp.]
MSQEQPFLYKISGVISNFFNPMVSLVIYFIYFSCKKLTWSEALQKFLPVILLLILPISLWIFWNVKKGKYSNMDVSNREQRKSLYVFIIVLSVLYMIYDYYKNDSLDWVLVFLIVLLLLMQISNYFIKSSMHTSLNVYVAALFFYINPVSGMIWLGIAIVVGITRIILRRHTLQEVLMGGLLATIVSFMYLYVAINMGVGC